jgi:hypothetical protein
VRLLLVAAVETSNLITDLRADTNLTAGNTFRLVELFDAPLTEQDVQRSTADVPATRPIST